MRSNLIQSLDWFDKEQLSKRKAVPNWNNMFPMFVLYLYHMFQAVLGEHDVRVTTETQIRIVSETIVIVIFVKFCFEI